MGKPSWPISTLTCCGVPQFSAQIETGWVWEGAETTPKSCTNQKDANIHFTPKFMPILGHGV